MSNMAVQMNYGEPSRGMPGLLYDLSLIHI